MKHEKAEWKVQCILHLRLRMENSNMSVKLKFRNGCVCGGGTVSHLVHRLKYSNLLKKSAFNHQTTPTTSECVNVCTWHSPGCSLFKTFGRMDRDVKISALPQL